MLRVNITFAKVGAVANASLDIDGTGEEVAELMAQLFKTPEGRGVLDALARIPPPPDTEEAG